MIIKNVQFKVINLNICAKSSANSSHVVVRKGNLANFLEQVFGQVKFAEVDLGLAFLKLADTFAYHLFLN